MSAPTSLAPRLRRTRIGRIVTDAPTSTRLMLASGYFLLGGAVATLTALVAAAPVIGGAPLGDTTSGVAPSAAMRWVGVAWIALFGGLYLWAGLLLGRSARRGAIVAACIIAASVLLDALYGRLTVGGLIFPAVGLAVLWSIRDELR